jgi:hemoglobin-like flavoprotein
MDFVKKNYWIPFVFCSLLSGIIVFFISYRSAQKHLTTQISHTIQIATNVKWQLLERKLYSLEQQLNLLSKNETLNHLLSSTAEKNAALKPSVQFDQYIKSLLYSQGYSNLLVLNKSGEIAYTSTPNIDMSNVLPEIYQLSQRSISNQNSNSLSKVWLNKAEPSHIYFYQPIADTKGNFEGTLIIESPKEFLSIELHNTISLDSLSSYLVSTQGIMDEWGKINPDTCTSCTWHNESFIQFSPDKRIKDTWKLFSVYPTSQITAQHLIYLSALDGMIAFFVAGIFVMIVIYCIQLARKSKGITNADILLVQTTWNAVSEFSTKVIAGFYKHLFALAPEVKPMFKSDQATQEKRMALMINTIVNSADSLEEFKGSIAQLAKKHVHMGVKREYFPIVVTAIINSVEDQYGKKFTDAHRKAWYKILNQISAIMLEEMESYQSMLRNTSSERPTI